MILLTALGFAFCLLVFVVLMFNAKELATPVEFAIWVILFLASVSIGLIMLLMTIEGVFK